MPTSVAILPTWDFLTTFNVRTRSVSWSALDSLLELRNAASRQQQSELEAERRAWNARLADIGGDPSQYRWRGFRPLRTSREEDWSDWLQHLLATSASGAFARFLLSSAIGPAVANFAAPQVSREEPVGDRRADLVVAWSGGRLRTHVEVKVGDQAFAKTFPTSKLLMDRDRTLTWTHCILLPPSDLRAWGEVADQEAPKYPGIRVHAIDWRQVAEALRRVLWSRAAETTAWRVWAWTFVGVVEQRLLDLDKPEATCLKTATAIMKEARDGLD